MSYGIKLLSNATSVTCCVICPCAIRIHSLCYCRSMLWLPEPSSAER